MVREIRSLRAAVARGDALALLGGRAWRMVSVEEVWPHEPAIVTADTAIYPLW